jgi:hypothetical protein
MHGVGIEEREIGTMNAAGGGIAVIPLLIVVIGVAAVAMLLINPRTRVLGGVILGVGLVGGFLLIVAFRASRTTSETHIAYERHSAYDSSQMTAKIEVQRNATSPPSRSVLEAELSPDFRGPRATAGASSPKPEKEQDEFRAEAEGPLAGEAAPAPGPASDGRDPSSQFYFGEEHKPSGQASPAQWPPAVGKSWAILPLYLIVPLLGVGAVLMMLLNQKTRVFGWTILGIGLLAVLIIVPLLHLWATPSMPLHDNKKPAMSTRAKDRAAPPQPITKGAKTKPPREGSGITPAPAPDGLLPALARAIGRALADDGQRKPAPMTAEAEPPAVEKKELVNAPNQTPRPAWVDTPSGWNGEPGNGYRYQALMTIGPYFSRQECAAKLPEHLESFVAQYARKLPDVKWTTADRVRLPWDQLEGMVKERWEEWLPTSVGSTTPADSTYQERPGWVLQLHVMVVVDQKMKERIEVACKRETVSKRLWHAGAGLAAVLAALSVVFGYLKIDQATAGTYRGRLRFATFVAALVVAILFGLSLA